MNEDLISLLTKGTGGSSGASDNSKGKTPSNPLMDALTARLIAQTKSVSSSSSSDLQSEIAKAMEGTVQAGALTKERLQSERTREIGYASDAANATITGALEGQTGYARQVHALNSLAETTQKSVRDLDARYQEAIMSNDANTASQLSALRMQKLKFQQDQEQNFYNNLLATGNLQEQALSRQQQGEQFWAEKQQKDNQFVIQMATSNHQFEKNYGISLQEMGLKQQQLEIERSKYNLSLAEYNDRKKELAKEKETTETRAIIANTLKNSLVDENGKVRPRERLLTSEFMLKMKEETKFGGSTEELAKLIGGAYDDMTKDQPFMDSLAPKVQPPAKVNTGLLPTYGRSVAGGADIVGSWLDKIFWSGQ